VSCIGVDTVIHMEARRRFVGRPCGRAAWPDTFGLHVMVYRSYEGDEALRRAQEPRASDVLTALDVSGRAGSDAVHGVAGRDGIYAGEDGGRGGDAGPAGRGEDGGAIEITLLHRDDQRTGLTLTGHMVSADRRSEPVAREIDFGDSGFIDLFAHGGNGGRGGRGGDGGNGARGRSGSDATRYSSGTDGGPGGDGGDGGSGSHGGAGGRGGQVTVNVDSKDTDLLMLLRHEVAGGRGGAAGANGSGGAGGAGGSGGSSYSWTETESYTDSSGNQQSRTTYHSNSGGSSGRRGASGSAGRAHLRPGQDGGAGAFFIKVHAHGHVRAYHERYDLRIIGLEHRNENEDGIYEPTEKVHVGRIEVMNVGGMPTPAHSDVHITLVDKGWVAPEQKHLTLPASLHPGDSHVFEQETLSFTIALFTPHGPSDPLHQVETIHLRATVPAVRRDFEDFERELAADKAAFVIRFPVQASPIETLFSLAPGEAARVRWTITNISQKAFGARSELKRALAVRLMLHESDLGPDDVLYFDEAGRRVPLDRGFARVIEHIGPSESLTFEGTLALAPHVEAYRSAGLWLELHLGEIAEPAKLRPIQYRAFTLRAAERFEARPDADLLLVVGNRTTRDEIQAWEALSVALGRVMCVWDLSLHGGIGEGASAPGAAALLERFRGKTVLVLNGAMDTPRGERALRDFFDKDELLAAAAAETHVVFVGRPVEMPKLLVPTFAGEGALVVTGKDAERGERAYLTQRGPDAARARQILGRGCDRVEVVERYWLWGKPKEKRFVARARALQEALESEYPERRYVVIHHYAPQKDQEARWPERWRVGEFEIRRTLDTGAGMIASVKARSEGIHDPRFVLGRDGVMALVRAFHFEQKLSCMGALLARVKLLSGGSPTAGAAPDAAQAERRALADSLVAALFADLVHEQAALLRKGWCVGPGTKEMAAKLPRLTRLGSGDFLGDAPLDAASEEAEVLIRLVAYLLFVSGGHVRWIEWLPPFVFLRRAPKVRRAAHGLVASLIVRAFGGAGDLDEAARGRLAQAKTSIRREVQAIERDYKRAVRLLEVERGQKMAYCLRALGLAAEGQDSTTDAGHLFEAASRVMSRDELMAIRVDDGKRKKRRARLMESASAARAAMLVSEGCEALVARAEGRTERAAARAVEIA